MADATTGGAGEGGRVPERAPDRPSRPSSQRPTLRLTLRRAARLTRAACLGPGAWKAGLLFATILSLSFVEIWISLRQIDWYRDFYNALEKVDAAAAVHQIGIFCILTASGVVTFLIGDYLQKALQLRLRTRLTVQAIDHWLGNRAYWLLRPGFGATPVENPDQRVAEDCRQFVEKILEYSLELISKVVALVSYVALLWSLSSFVLAITVFGFGIEIPRYMVWLAPIYVGLASLVIHLGGRALKRVYFTRERAEADFRHALIQIRASADLVAQTQGEAAEKRRLDQRFGQIELNWRRLMRREFLFYLFHRPYQTTILRVPTFFALPAYLAGAVTLGGMMQLANAFGSVTQTLSWFIFRYRALAEFVAVCERLDGLMQNARAPEPLPGAAQKIDRVASADGWLRLEGLRLSTPDGRWLDPTPDYALRPGARLWIAGGSGQGKTTLLSAVSGLWIWGEGRIEAPAGKFAFLPAGAPVLAETIRAAACHPEDPATHDPKRLHRVLSRLGLGHRLDPCLLETSLSGLSMGERQRLGLARAVMLRPDWLVLDEATAALDPMTEADLLGWLAAELPDTTIIMVAHRRPTGLRLDDTLHIGQTDPERKTA
ncbi:ABC transporter ATP-binding protein/permease [Paracoccus aminophilus]|uniref:ABC transporter ATP-binding protein/permease n=1 Tax=Paracoccus aminophilus TaxID=34003 RepID=UPI000A00D75C|nr:SbmA/BacA-like family transporter [Paracoccus aminophilus]